MQFTKYVLDTFFCEGRFLISTDPSISPRSRPSIDPPLQSPTSPPFAFVPKPQPSWPLLELTGRLRAIIPTLFGYVMTFCWWVIIRSINTALFLTSAALNFSLVGNRSFIFQFFTLIPFSVIFCNLPFFCLFANYFTE